MSNYYIRKVLEKDTAQTILNWMESDSCEYEDGIKTLSGTESDESKKIIKRNIEAVGPSEVRSEMRQLMWKEFDTDVDFFSFTAPKLVEVLCLLKHILVDITNPIKMLHLMVTSVLLFFYVNPIVMVVVPCDY